MKLSTKNKCVDILSFALFPTYVYNEDLKKDVLILFEFYYQGYWFNWTNPWYKLFLTPNSNWSARMFQKRTNKC